MAAQAGRPTGGPPNVPGAALGVLLRIGSSITRRPEIPDRVLANVRVLTEWIRTADTAEDLDLLMRCLIQHSRNVGHKGAAAVAPYMDNPELLLKGARQLYEYGLSIGGDPS